MSSSTPCQQVAGCHSKNSAGGHRMSSPNDPAARNSVLHTVAVFCRSTGTWQQGLAHETKPGEVLSVEFSLHGSRARKKLHANSHSLCWKDHPSAGKDMRISSDKGDFMRQPGMMREANDSVSETESRDLQGPAVVNAEDVLCDLSRQLATMSETLTSVSGWFCKLQSDMTLLQSENADLKTELKRARGGQRKAKSSVWARSKKDVSSGPPLDVATAKGSPEPEFPSPARADGAATQPTSCRRDGAAMQGQTIGVTSASWRLHVADRIAEISRISKPVCASPDEKERAQLLRASGSMWYESTFYDDPGPAADGRCSFWPHLQRFIVHPNSAWCLGPDLLGGLLIGHDVVVAPMSYFAFWDDSAPFIASVMWFAAIYWTVDIARTFLKGREDGGNLEMRASEIAKHYAKTWLLVDIFVVLWDWLQLLFSPDVTGKASRSWHFTKAIHALRTLRILRLIRIMKLAKLLTTLEDRIQSALVMVFFKGTQLITGITMAAHYAGCYWYAFGSWDTLGFGDSWVKRHVFDSEDAAHLYFLSLHWSLGQSGLASTDIAPTNVIECLYASCVSLMWLVMLCSLFSCMTVTLIKAADSGRDLSEQEAMIRKYLSENRVSAALGTSVLRFFRLHYKARARRVHAAEVMFLGDLPVSLCTKMHTEIRCPVLMKHPAFQRLGLVSPASLLALCDLAWLQRHCCAGEEVFAAGTSATQTLVVASGSFKYYPCNVNSAADAPFSVDVVAGFWISEPALWFEWRHQGALKAVTSCALMGLDLSSFQHVAEELRSAGLLTMDFLAKYAALVKASYGEGLAPVQESREAGAGADSFVVISSSSTENSIFLAEICEDFAEHHRLSQLVLDGT